jgi:mono/diheme cytochrome c family protein
MKTKNQLSKAVPGIIFIVSFGFNIHVALGQKAGKWEAPSSANNLKKPFKGNAAAIAEGKTLYMSMCNVCHGPTGKGNGDASVTLSPQPANFLSIEIENESDGAIFWKLTQGKPPMASYKDLLTDDQRWKLVTYIRNLEENNKSNEKKK